MALITVDRIKTRLRIEDDDSDELIGDLLASATAAVERYLGRAIYDPDLSRNFGAVRAEYTRVRGLRVSDQAPNDRFEASGYDDLGRVTNASLSDPVSVQAPLPLSSLPDYANSIEPICNEAIAAYVAEMYTRPNSMELSSREGSSAVNYGRLTHGMPARVRAMLEPIRALSQV